MLTFDAVDGRRVAVKSKRKAHAPSGLARLVPTAAASGLSTEMLGLAYGPAENVGEYIEMQKMRPLATEHIASGRCVLYQLPTASLAGDHLPAETRLGALEVGGCIAHGYFYRPFNRMEDVVAHFSPLGLTAGLDGVVLPHRRFQVISESYTTGIPDLGVVDVERPRGVPQRRAQVGLGGMWVDRTRERAKVIFEHPSARLTFRPLSAEVTPDFERATAAFAAGIGSLSWG